VTAPDLSYGLEELAGLISYRVGGWHDFGYETPPAPGCKTIPPLGERSPEAIKSAHAAIKEIDELTAQLHALRQQLAGELRADEDARAARVDAMLAARRDPLDFAAGAEACPGCVGRGRGDACCVCGLLIPPRLRRRPGDPSELGNGGAR
jgi:hypothetical protein